MNGSKKPDPFQQLTASLVSLNSSSPNQLQHDRNTARSPAASRIPNMLDAELKKFIESTEKMLSDRSLLNALPDSGQKLRDNLEKARAELNIRQSSPAYNAADTNEEIARESSSVTKASPKHQEDIGASLAESMQSMKVVPDREAGNEERAETLTEPSHRTDRDSVGPSSSPSTTTNYMDKKSVIRDLLLRTPDTSRSLSSLQLRDDKRPQSPLTASSPPKSGPRAAKVLSLEEGCELAKQHELARKEAQERHAQYMLTSFAPRNTPVSEPIDPYSRAYDFYNHREQEEDDPTDSETEDAEDNIEEESEPDEKDD